MKMRRDEDAVSEVVGVMLMITITLVIVALVAVYASGAAAGSDEHPVRANIVASDCGPGIVQESDSTYQVVFEHMAGDSFDLARVDLILGVREDTTRRITIRDNPGAGGSYLEGFEEGARDVYLGDRFLLHGRYENGEAVFTAPGAGGEFRIKPGRHLTYRFVDRLTGVPISSGEIEVR